MPRRLHPGCPRPATAGPCEDGQPRQKSASESPPSCTSRPWVFGAMPPNRSCRRLHSPDALQDLLPFCTGMTGSPLSLKWPAARTPAQTLRRARPSWRRDVCESYSLGTSVLLLFCLLVLWLYMLALPVEFRQILRWRPVLLLPPQQA